MKSFYFVVVLGCLLTSCINDLLDKTPLDKLSTESFYEDESQAMMGLIGVYSSLIPTHNSLPWYQFEFMSDNTSSMDWTGSQAFSSWNQTASTVTAVEKWKQNYKLIVRANTFLKNIENIEMSSDSVKRQMQGEARFLRAFMYADLIHFYGDVPLILEEQTLDNAKVARTPKEKVLEEILKDYDYAIENLPKKYPADNIGRATKGAALAYKTKVLLYNEKWEEAASVAFQLIDLNVYKLFNDYEGLFEEENENNSEVIFDIQYMKDLSAQPWPSSCLVFTSWPCGCPTLSMVDSYYMKNGLPITDPLSGYNEQDPFVNRDPRMEASIGLPGYMYGTSILIPNDLTRAEGVTGLKMKKYSDIFNSNKENSGLNTILMRYADVLLMRAEALIEAGNTGQEVYDLINQVRERVNMPKIEDVEGTGLSQDELRNILRHERRVEFFGEGTRYSDLLRWKDKNAFHDTYGYNLSKLSDPSDPSKWIFERVKVMERTYAERGWLWPIPQEELQNNENLSQNPYY